MADDTSSTNEPVEEEPVHEDRLKAWTIQLVNGKALDPAPATAREKRVAAALQQDIEQIQKDGGIVEIPSELPSADDDE